MSGQRGKGKTNEASNIEDFTNDDQTRQLRSTTNMDKFCREFIKVYVAECEKTRTLIKEENQQTRTLMKELITTIKDESSKTRISHLETSTLIVNKIDACHHDSMKVIKETFTQMNKSDLREDISDARKTIEKTWNEKYKNRNDLFWRYHRNKKLVQLYNSELLKENPTIPRKFLPNYNGNETTEEKEIMENLSKEKVRAELQLQKIRYERQLESVKQIDGEIRKLICSNFNEQIALTLQEQWNKQCKLGEQKSIEEFSKKEQWFKENWMSLDKPEQGGNKQFQGQQGHTHYRRYNRNDYNRDKKRNNYRPNNRDEREELRYNRNQGQDSNENRAVQQSISNVNNNNLEGVSTTLVEVLASLSPRTSSTETIIVPETQNDSEMNSFLVNSPSQ